MSSTRRRRLLSPARSLLTCRASFSAACRSIVTVVRGAEISLRITMKSSMAAGWGGGCWAVPTDSGVLAGASTGVAGEAAAAGVRPG